MLFTLTHCRLKLWNSIWARGVFLPLSLSMSADTRHTWQTPAISGCKDDEAVPSCQHQISSNLLTASGLYKNKLWAEMWLGATFSLFSHFLYSWPACSPFHLPPTSLGRPSSLRLLGTLTLLSIFNEPYLDIRHFVLCVGGVRAVVWK